MGEDPSWADLPPGEPIPGKTYRADGWVYREISWASFAGWGQLLEIVGAGNYVVLAISEWKATMCRGQILVSPEGMERCLQWRSKQLN